MKEDGTIGVHAFCMAPLNTSENYELLKEACCPITQANPGDVVAIGWRLSLEDVDGIVEAFVHPIDEFLVIDDDGVAEPAYLQSIRQSQKLKVVMAMAHLQQEGFDAPQFQPILQNIWHCGARPKWVNVWVSPDFAIVKFEVKIELRSTIGVGKLDFHTAEKIAPFILLEWPQSHHQVMLCLEAANQACRVLDKMKLTDEGRHLLSNKEEIIKAGDFS
eukprot:GHVR01158879.1.p1 GENE.GHVR01158879.1~~GHVR01158879.1.p1  ORF type:complete len:218 (+),score=24.38 GHVR01158879.1:704-1357(+)